MALKQVKPQQRNKQPRVISKQLAPSKKEAVRDPWSFLELIDAPQWVDLALEASLMGKEGYDPWFDVSHKHHVISRAGLNSSMTWLRLGKSNQANQVQGSALSKDTSKECQKVVYISKGKDNAGQLNKAGHAQCWPQNQVKRVQLQKGVASLDAKNTDRASSAHLSFNRFSGSQDTGCTFSGSSGISECEPSRSLKYHSSCSERLSVTSSLQPGSESNKVSSYAQSESLNSDQPEDSFDTPTCSIGGGQSNRSSSSASYCPPRPKLRFSYEIGVSNLTKSLSVHMADQHSSGDSVATIASGSCASEEERVGKGCARIWEEASSDIRKVGDHLDYGRPSSGGFTAECNTVNRNLLLCQQTAQRVVKYDINIRERRSETRFSHIGSLPRKQLYPGKENMPNPKLEAGDPRQARLQVKHKLSHTAAPLAIASSKMANVKLGSVGFSSGVGCRKLQPKTEERHSTQCSLACSAQVAPPESSISQHLKGGRISSFAHQRKRTEVRQPTVGGSASEKTSKFEKDLAALVALVTHFSNSCLGRDSGDLLNQ